MAQRDDKLVKIYERLNSIDTTLAAQHVSLREHIRRTEILEEKLQPVEKHVAMVDGALKLLGVIGIVAAIVGHISISRCITACSSIILTTSGISLC